MTFGESVMEILFENSDIVVCVKEPGISSEDGENSVPKLLREQWGVMTHISALYTGLTPQ